MPARGPLVGPGLSPTFTSPHSLSPLASPHGSELHCVTLTAGAAVGRYVVDLHWAHCFRCSWARRGDATLTQRRRKRASVLTATQAHGTGPSSSPCVCVCLSVAGMPWAHRTAQNSHRNNAKELADYLTLKYGSEGYLLFNLW